MIAVVIPTRNRPLMLARLLSALKRQVEAPTYEVVVVNDGSHNEMYAAVMSGHRGYVKYVVLPHWSGPAAARNEGVRGSCGEVILFSDDDCVPPPNWIATASNVLNEQQLDAVGGPALPLEPTGGSMVMRYLAASGYLQRPITVEGRLVCIPTANLCVRRPAFVALSGFDERFCRPGGEDTDFLHRFVRAGFRAAFSPLVATFHDNRFSWLALMRRYYNYGFGVAQHLIYRSENLDYGFLLSNSRRGLVKELASLVRWAVSSPRHLEFSSSLPRIDRVAFRMIAVSVELAYQLGGVDGLRHADRMQSGQRERLEATTRRPLT